VDKRDLVKPANDTAESRFRRAVALLNQARISEAEEQLGAALQADPAHVAARQTYVALLLEQQRVGGALRLLREALEANPGHPGFSLALARVYAEQRDHPAALAAIDKAGAAAQSADFQALKGAVLQRMGRHAEAVTAYQEAVQKSAQPAGGTWAGLGVSLEAVGRPGEAVQAYRRALGAAPLAPELRTYTEDRIRALQ
jgi:MSHA biogenesis protein MshN